MTLHSGIVDMRTRLLFLSSCAWIPFWSAKIHSAPWTQLKQKKSKRSGNSWTKGLSINMEMDLVCQLNILRHRILNELRQFHICSQMQPTNSPPLTDWRYIKDCFTFVLQPVSLPIRINEPLAKAYRAIYPRHQDPTLEKYSLHSIRGPTPLNSPCSL